MNGTMRRDRTGKRKVELDSFNDHLHDRRRRHRVKEE
jgi:hypothetical protein